MLIALSLLAEPSAAAQSAQAPALVVRSTTDLGLDEAMVQQALEAHLGDLGYGVYVDFSSADRPWPPGTAHVELRSDGRGGLEVLMQREADPQPWGRTLPAQDDGDLLLESLGVLIRSMLGAPRPKPKPKPKPAPKPEPKPEPQSTPKPARARHDALDIALGYRGDTVSSEHPWHSAIALDVGGRTHRGLALGGGVAYVPPHDRAPLSLQRVGGHARVGFALRPGRRLQPAVFAVVAAEALGWSGASPAASPQPGWAPRVGAGVSAELRGFFAGPWFLGVRVGAIGWALGADLEERRGTTRSALIRTTSFAGQAWAHIGYRFAL